MVKWRRLKEKDIENDPLHRWLVNLDRNSPPELVEEVAKMDSAIMAANEKMNAVISDDPESEFYWKRVMARMDERGRLEYARDEGRNEGRNEGFAEGIEQSAIKIAGKLKKAGDSIEKIQAVTGLSLEVIGKL